MVTDFHPLELKVLEALKRENRQLPIEELAKIAGLDAQAATKASFWLSSKGLCEISDKPETALLLTKRGEQVLAEGLPEKNVLHAIAAGALSMEELYKLFGSEQLNAALGRLRSAGFVKMAKTEPKGVVLTITPSGTGWLSKKSEIELAIESVKEGKMPDAKCQQEFLSRGFAEKSVRKNTRVSLTKAGAAFDIVGAAGRGKTGSLTSAMLESGAWKKTGFDFREYDINAPSETINPGRPHPLRLMMEKVRTAFLNMGFTESAGPWVESSFWCFDSIFVPQDHPAREMADTFYMKTPSSMPLPESEFVARVKGAHEHGVAGSTGWKYRWQDEVAKGALLRPHTTSVSARALHSGITPPAKIFCVGKAFRNETLDYKHLSELHQVEGIVFDKNVTFNNLLGYLKEFLSLLGFERVRFRPAFFPYTELSVEPEVFLEDKCEWMELGGAGIFRPEVVVPLTGVDCPVLAWGLGLDRLAMMMLGLQDIRELYRNDMGWLRSVPAQAAFSEGKKGGARNDN